MRTLLVLVDLQNDFIDGSLGTPEAQAIIPNVIELIRHTKAVDVVMTQDTHCNNYLDTFEGKRLPVKHCIDGTFGHQIENQVLHTSCESAKRIIPIPKDSFGSYRLMEFMAENHYEKIEIAGLCTDICVISNALMTRSFFPSIPITVYADCCAGTTPENHEAALKVMKSCQIDVVDLSTLEDNVEGKEDEEISDNFICKD